MSEHESGSPAGVAETPENMADTSGLVEVSAYLTAPVARILMELAGSEDKVSEVLNKSILTEKYFLDAVRADKKVLLRERDGRYWEVKLP